MTLPVPPTRKPTPPHGASRAHGKRTFRQNLTRGVFIVLGAILVAVALELFLVPNSITDGGITGISVMASYLSGWKLGIFLFVLNLPFLIVGYKQIGKTFALSTLLGITVLSIGTVLLHPVHAFVDDTLLAFVFGGIFLGVGTGLVIRNGGSLDGTEIIAILVSRKTPFSVGEIVMFVNLFILSGAGFVFGWDHALFSILAYYIAYKMIDVTIEGMNESKSVWIISDRIEDIGNAILDRLGRGVTYLAGEGGFSGDPKKVIFCVITRLEEAKLKEIVNQFDDKAFMAVGNIHDVKGGRFKKKDIH
ncbi:YitT family protein [Saccharibacillus sp. CPCC 101409]|uniref:YitT family protein n=1 Tax=Saccharibacillus sp. CPCC 101409 TaxID=3058041 RepID=UPI002671C653|nr:YitT family protein [Saccharibacillus sp. CPCC 101409]MDO3413156.1 YitT family protein [Saccharibacillus sp. CPCC 101409]